MEKLANLIRYAIFLALFYFLLPFFIPFILAVIIVVLFEPLIKKLESKFKVKRVYSVLTLYTLFFASLFAAAYFFIFKIINQIVDFAKKMPEFVQGLYQNNQEIATLYAKLPADAQTYINDTLSSFASSVTERFSGYAGGIFTSILSFGDLFIAFIVFVISSYIMGFQAPLLKPLFLSFFANGTTRKGVEILLTKLKKAIVGFIRAQLILSLIVFVITWTGIKIIGLPYPSVSALFVVVIDLLPILGTGAAIIPWAAYLFVSGDVTSSVGLLILFLVLTLVRRSLEPKLLADTLGISALSSLISMYIGYCLMGFMGMILGPTLIIVLKALQDARLIEIKIKLKP